MDLAQAKRTIHSLKSGIQHQVSRFLFVDAMLLFCMSDKASLKELNNLFQSLELHTGLQINKDNQALLQQEMQA